MNDYDITCLAAIILMGTFIIGFAFGGAVATMDMDTGRRKPKK